MSLVLLLACASAAPDPEPPGTTPLGADPGLEPLYEVGELEGAAEQAFIEGMVSPITVATWFAALLDGLAEAPGCPHRDSLPDGAEGWSSYWKGECEGADHTVWGGWLVSEQRTQVGPTMLYEARHLYSFRGSTRDGGDLEAGAQLQLSWGMGAEDVRVFQLLMGTLVDPLAAAPLSSGVSIGVVWDGTWVPDRGFVGTVTGPYAGADSAVELSLDFQDGLPYPVGEVRLRDPTTAWWTVELPADGSGCGPASYGGEERGESCVGQVVGDALQAMIDADLAPE